MSDAEVFGQSRSRPQRDVLECINQVLEIWASDPPYNIKGKYWNIVLERQLMLDLGQGFLPKPLQQPQSADRRDGGRAVLQGVTEAAARGWEPIRRTS